MKTLRWAVAALLMLAPSADEAPDSSLSYMFAQAARELGDGPARFYVHPSGWDVEELITDLQSLTAPVLLAGTSFAFVHLLDALEDSPYASFLQRADPDEIDVLHTNTIKLLAGRIESPNDAFAAAPVVTGQTLADVLLFHVVDTSITAPVLFGDLTDGEVPTLITANNAIDTLSDVARDQSDRGLIAVLINFAYRPLVAEYEKLTDD